MVRKVTLFLGLILLNLSLYSQDNTFEVGAQLAENEKVKEIEQLLETVKEKGSFIELLDSGAIFNMPIGIMGKDKADPSYSILIDEVVLYESHATFTASMMLQNPFDGRKIAFQAKEVPFSFSAGIVGDYRLELVQEIPVNICNDVQINIKAGSYVECDCDGFKSLSLKGDLQLAEKTFVPSTAEGQTLPGKVSSYFETTIYSWSDMSFAISLDPFKLKSYPDFTFSCSVLAVDFSDQHNPDNLKFPAEYTSIYPVDIIQLWQGIYIQEASITLDGDKFKRKDNPKPLSIVAYNLIIDENGFSGSVQANELMSLQQGSMGGWNFSLETLSLKFALNDLVSAGFKGQMKIPVFEEDTFSYKAFVDVEGHYLINVGLEDSLDVNLFGNSKLTLYESSYAEVRSDENGFVPTVNLSGNISINAPMDASGGDQDEALSLADLEFQNFRVSTEYPRLDIEYMSYHGNGQGNLTKFPITIHSIEFRSTETSAKLSIGAAVNLCKSSDEGFSGKTTISLLADKVDYSYKFKGVQVDAIKINFEKKNAYKISGGVMFARGDAVYGKGFRGEIEAVFGPSFEVKSTAVFGNINGMRYFFVDGMLSVGKGIQAGPLTIFGFGGGVSKHMRMEPGNIDPNSFGASSSGIVYKPNENMGIGIQASVNMGVVDEKLVKAEAKFEIAFTKHGGISYISFEGNAECVTPGVDFDPKEFKELTQAIASGKIPKPEGTESSISARLHMFRDFENDVFHAELDMKVNVAGVLKGVGPDNTAGWAVLHVDPDEWYLHIGTPTNPIGVQLLGIAQIKAYFMAGHRMPSALPIHPKVAQILNINEEDIADKRDDRAMQNARGIAFGASFDMSTGDLTFLAFYARFDLGAGFDIMMINYGQNAYCKGSTPPLGINSWYATGQAYAYFSGKIGIKVKIFRKTKRFDIISLSTAAFLKAEGPNPTWMMGVVGGEYKILGGMIRGKCRFEAEVGDKCEIMGAGSKLANLQLISDVAPGNGDDDVDVFTTPQVVFNVPIESVQKISEHDGSSIVFRIKMKTLKLRDDEKEIPCDFEWNHRRDVVQIIPHYVLYPKTKYHVDAEIVFEERILGKWRPFKDQGEILVESKNVAFTTGELPDRIPDDEVKYCYPVKRQYNFMPNEYDQTYIGFRRDVFVFFEQSEEYEKKVRWSSNASIQYTNFSYNRGEKTLYMGKPQNFALSKVYNVEVIAIPTAASDDVDRNVTTTEAKEDMDDKGNEMVTTTKQAEGTITTSEEKVIYNVHFKTSKFLDFNSRFAENQINVRALYDRGYMEFYLITDMPGKEPLDYAELNGRNGQPALVQMEAILDETKYFTDYVYPLTYENYPWYGNHSIDWREVDDYGLHASRAISAWQGALLKGLTDQEIEVGMPLQQIRYSDIVYEQPYVWNQDFVEIRDGIIFETKDQVKKDPIAEQMIGMIKLRPVRPGNYPIRISYILPGKNIRTSFKEITLVNPFKTEASTKDEN